MCDTYANKKQKCLLDGVSCEESTQAQKTFTHSVNPFSLITFLGATFAN
jgi:hypothetical protein